MYTSFSWNSWPCRIECDRSNTKLRIRIIRPTKCIYLDCLTITGRLGSLSIRVSIDGNIFLQFPSLIVGHNGAQWAHDNVQWRPGHRPSVCSGAKLWSGPGHLQGRASLSLVTYRGGPHVPGHLQGRASYLVLCAAQCLVTDWSCIKTKQQCSIGLIYAYQAKPPVPYNHCVDNPISCLLTVG